MKQTLRDTNFHGRCATAMEYTGWRHRHGNGSLDCRLIAAGEMRWHMLEVHGETAAAAGLMARGFAVYLPTEAEIAVRRGRKSVRQPVMFAGLLFICVRAIERQRDRILSVPGVARIVRLGETAVIVPDAAIDRIKIIEMEKLIATGLITVDEEALGREPTKQKKRRKRKRGRRQSENMAPATPGSGDLEIRIMCLGDRDAEQTAVAAIEQAAIAQAPASHRRDLLYRAMGLLPPGESNTRAAASGIDNPSPPHAAERQVSPVAAGAGNGAERPSI
jgi:hypothetical protein